MSNTGSRWSGQPKLKVLAKVGRLPDPTPENAADVGIEMWRLIAGPHFDEAEARAMGARSMARSFRPDAVGRQTAAMFASGDRTEALGAVQAPTLVVHGLLDPLVKPSGGIATAEAIRGSRLLMFPDMGHDLPGPRRAEIADAIAANAARAAGARAAAAQRIAS
jgi:pimeloyl-ACP methyl ester carboxylesterase